MCQFSLSPTSRTSDVLRRASLRQVEIEIDEAKTVAEQEILHILVEEERSRIHSKMEQACSDLEITLEREFVESENQRKNLRVKQQILVNAVKRWLAKKELRARCMERFVKEFDEKSGVYYYKDLKSVSAL